MASGLKGMLKDNLEKENRLLKQSEKKPRPIEEKSVEVKEEKKTIAKPVARERENIPSRPKRAGAGRPKNTELGLDKRVQYTITLPSAMAGELRRIAKENKISLASVIETACEGYLAGR